MFNLLINAWINLVIYPECGGLPEEFHERISLTADVMMRLICSQNLQYCCLTVSELPPTLPTPCFHWVKGLQMWVIALMCVFTLLLFIFSIQTTDLISARTSGWLFFVFVLIAIRKQISRLGQGAVRWQLSAGSLSPDVKLNHFLWRMSLLLLSSRLFFFHWEAN